MEQQKSIFNVDEINRKRKEQFKTEPHLVRMNGETWWVDPINKTKELVKDKNGNILWKI